MRKVILAWTMALAIFAIPAFAQDEELLKGVELYQEGRYQEAVDTLRAVVRANPKNKIAWVYLGGSLENLGNEKEALSAFRKKVGGKSTPIKYEKELEITGKVKAEYDDDAALKRGLQGNVILFVEFKADGQIGFVVVVRELSKVLALSAVRAARAMTFQPAIANGNPVPVIRPVSFDFHVR
jgi:tetratricopeptide (TPR) repeat protein